MELIIKLLYSLEDRQTLPYFAADHSPLNTYITKDKASAMTNCIGWAAMLHFTQACFYSRSFMFL